MSRGWNQLTRPGHITLPGTVYMITAKRLPFMTGEPVLLSADGSPYFYFYLHCGPVSAEADRLKKCLSPLGEKGIF